MTRWYSDLGYSNWKPSKTDAFYKCAHGHKPVVIREGVTVIGGAASSPVGGPYDLMVSFDHGKDTDPAAFPWNPGEFIYFPVPDYQAPKNPEEYKKLVEYVAAALDAGKSVHVGCMAGHGRTGTFLAALVTHMTGNKESIQFLRDTYCHRAVESTTQMEFLEKHFGVTKLKGSKTLAKDQPVYVVSDAEREYYGGGKKRRGKKLPETLAADLPRSQLIKPVVTRFNIWGINDLPLSK